MKKNRYIRLFIISIVIILLSNPNIHAQINVVPEGRVVLRYQSEVNAFAANLVNIDRIEGSIYLLLIN